MTNRVVLASSNHGKLCELQEALSGTRWRLTPQAAMGVTDAIEDKLTFVENALTKARHATAITGLPAIADDSGLVVPALDGAPGIFSARFSGQGDAGNNTKLLDAMSTLTDSDRDAHYFCALVFLLSSDDPTPIIAEGRWQGRIGLAAAGDGGFGYDPIFEVAGLGCTAAQLSPEAKRELSHRGQAVTQLCEALGRSR